MNRLLSIAALGFGLILAGCASLAPEDPDLINDRLRPGPGLLSGTSGEFVLLRSGPESGRPETD